MANVFLSYRRDDSSGFAGRIYDRLSRHFDRGQLFMDVDTIDPGVDFVEAVERAVGSCAVLLVIIGGGWLKSADEHGRRLDDPDDVVRVEIATALERKIRVIPVLVGGARMPRAQDLPEPLRALARRNALEVGHARFDADMDVLVEALTRALGADASRPAATAAGTSSGPPAARRGASRAGPEPSPLARRLLAVGDDRTTELALSADIYTWQALAPDGDTLYLSRFREEIKHSQQWDLIAYDMATGRVARLADVGSDGAYYSGFIGDVLFKTMTVEAYKTHRVLCFEGTRRVQRFDDLVVSSMTVVNGKLVFMRDGRFFWAKGPGSIQPLDFGGRYDWITAAHPTRDLVMLKRKRSDDLADYHLVSLDSSLRVAERLWTFSDTAAVRLWSSSPWTDTHLLLIETTDTNGDGQADYRDKRSKVVKALDLASGTTAVLVPGAMELRGSQGHPSGVALFADEVVADQHVRVSAYDAATGMVHEIANLRGGAYRDFCLDGAWNRLVFKKVSDSTGEGTFYDWKNRSTVHCLALA